MPLVFYLLAWLVSTTSHVKDRMCLQALELLHDHPPIVVSHRTPTLSPARDRQSEALRHRHPIQSRRHPRIFSLVHGLLLPPALHPLLQAQKPWPLEQLHGFYPLHPHEIPPHHPPPPHPHRLRHRQLLRMDHQPPEIQLQRRMAIWSRLRPHPARPCRLRDLGLPRPERRSRAPEEEGRARSLHRRRVGHPE